VILSVLSTQLTATIIAEQASQGRSMMEIAGKYGQQRIEPNAHSGLWAALKLAVLIS
jgi:hypothetical protein